MKKQFLRHAGVNSSRHRLLAATILACSLAPGQLLAQITEQRTHAYNNYDVKNYCIDGLKNTGKQAMAGTIFNTNGDNRINLMVTDNNPGSPGATIVNRQYDDPGFDERSVGVHFVEQDNITIVAARTQLGGSRQTNVEILRTDGSGFLLGSFIVNDPSSMDDLHPTASLVVGSMLYVCGYATAQGIPVPSFSTSKEIFVLSFDLNSNSLVDSRRFDYSYTSSGYDFDMPMRMRLIRNNGNEYIFVGGSCNGYNNSVPGWGAPNTGFYGASLCLILQQDLTIQADKPFSRFWPVIGTPSGDTLALGEYSNDISQDPATGGYFIFGNDYVARNSQPEPDVQINCITYVDQNFDVPATLRNRFRGPGFDYTWFVSLLPGNNAGSVILSGIQTSRDGGMPGSPYPTSMANVNPYLAEIVPTYTGGTIGVTTLSWKTILSSLGTGDPAVYANSYMKLGGFNSSIAFTPAYAMRDLSWTNDIFLSAPIWHYAGRNKLNLKLVRTDKYGALNNDCPVAGSYLPSGSVINTYSANRSNPGNTNFAMLTQYAEPEQDFTVNAYLNCPGAFVFKTADEQSAGSEAGNDFSIAPNPAAGQITIKLGAGNETGNLEVMLADMTGRKVADLCQGNAAAINGRQLLLPALAPGLYQVMISRNGQRMPARKLVIR